ncbi:MAG: ABC transporter permease [Mucilaginibacter polytrichastri]|nr:ABC transporter permease [Mucilaginibacter polytrichastri]
MIFFRLFYEALVFATDSLRQNKLRTLLSLLGITIGIFTIITVFSGIDTLRNNLQASVDKLGSNSIYIEKWPWAFGGDYPWWKYMRRPVPTLREFEMVKNRSQTAAGVTFMAGSNNKTITYLSRRVEGAEVSAVTHEYEKTWTFDLSGRYFTEGESKSGAPVCIIGADIADGLFGSIPPIGKMVKVFGRKLQVIGVFAREGEDALGISADKRLVMPLNFARNVFNVQNEDFSPNIVVRGKSGLGSDEIESELRGVMRSVRRLPPSEEDDFALNKTTILTNGLDQLFGIINKAGLFVGIFSILVGGFGIANIMFVSVKERTSIIGIQKSLGAKNYVILVQFLFEAIFLCLIGGLIGLMMVYLATLGIHAAFDVRVILGLKNIMIGIGSSVAIGVISGIIPAYGASRLDPVEAIRSK